MEELCVNQEWAVVLPPSSAGALAALRAEPGLLVRQFHDQVWLRGTSLDKSLRQRLLSLPATDRFLVGENGVLTPWNRLAPQGHLPVENWTLLADWLQLSLPTAAWPGLRPPPVALTLERASCERPVGALLVDLQLWQRYAETAPQVRLEGIAFVVNASGQAILRGASLPPIPGIRLVDDHDILTPAGWMWRPAIDAELLRIALGLWDGECALWLTTDHWQRIAQDAWVRGGRSAVRASAREAADG